MLVAAPTDCEITTALFSMHSLKSLEPDCMSPLLFKHCWNIVNINLFLAVRDFFQRAKLLKALNHTFVALIPKNDHGHKVDHYRPIVLCNIVYKVITKILAIRLRGVLEKIISPQQFAYIPNRSIHDNTIICHKVMHHMNRKKGCLRLMAIKIDLSKAYDRVDWHFLSFTKLGKTVVSKINKFCKWSGFF